MNTVLRITLIVISALVAIYTIRKIRKSQLGIDDSVFWIGFSVLLLVMSIFPQIPTYFSKLLGFMSPINFVLLLVIFLVLVKLFKLAIDLSVTKQRLNSLIQRIAILNHEVDENTSQRLSQLEKNSKNDSENEE